MSSVRASSRRIRALAFNVFRELIREKVVLGFASVAFFMVILSLFLGEFSFDEQERLMVDFSLMIAEWTAVALALLQGASALPREIHRQTCLLVLARPVSRTQFLWGQFLGLGLVLTVLLAVLFLTLSVLLQRASAVLALLVLSILLKALVLLAWAVLASNFVRPTLAVLSGLTLYLLGHWLGDLEFFAAKSGPFAVELVRMTRWIVPNFDLFNWKSHFHLVHPPVGGDIMGMILQCAAWTGVYLGLSGILFGRKDLV